MVIAALALALGVQGAGCATPEQRHRILTIFFDGVPRLHPPKPRALPEEIAEGEQPGRARGRGAPPIVSVHGPVAEKACDQCHSSRYSNRLKLPRKDLCWNCHDPRDFAGKVVHGPFQAGYCEACHYPHRSPYRHLLVSAKADLCQGCHDPADLEDVAEHRSSEGRVCIDCHDPHAADRKYMLKRDDQAS